MARPIQTPEQSLELAQEFGIKGKLDLQLDETVVPVRMVGGVARAGNYSGFFTDGLRNAHGGIGDLIGSINPYARIGFFDTPAAQDPSEATHDCWLMAAGINVEFANAPNLAAAEVSVSYPVRQPELSQTGVFFTVLWAESGNLAQRAWHNGDALYVDGAFGAGSFRMLDFPLFMPPGAVVQLASNCNAVGGVYVDAKCLFWTGPKGTRPPGA